MPAQRKLPDKDSPGASSQQEKEENEGGKKKKKKKGEGIGKGREGKGRGGKFSWFHSGNYIASILQILKYISTDFAALIFCVTFAHQSLFSSCCFKKVSEANPRLLFSSSQHHLSEGDGGGGGGG